MYNPLTIAMIFGAGYVEPVMMACEFWLLVINTVFVFGVHTNERIIGK